MEGAVRAAREYLATLDDAAFGAASPLTPKFISPSDPASQWTGAHKGHAFFAYATNYLIDTEHAVIVDVIASLILDAWLLLVGLHEMLRGFVSVRPMPAEVGPW